MNRDVERILDALKADGYVLQDRDEARTEVGNRLEIDKLHMEVRDLCQEVIELRRQVKELISMMPHNTEVFRQLQQMSSKMTHQSLEWRLQRLEAGLGTVSIPSRKLIP